MSDGSFLCNSLNLSLGFRQDGHRVHDIHLPPWAKGNIDFYLLSNITCGSVNNFAQIFETLVLQIEELHSYSRMCSKQAALFFPGFVI